jgi:uncharacterized membrane protein YfcA
MSPPLVIAIAFGASLLAALSGGSSSMITTPAWVALGASFPVAVAADKIAGTFWTLAAARAYLTRQVVDRPLLLLMGLAGVAGAAAGAFLATTVNEGILRRGAGALILGALALTLRPRPVPAGQPRTAGSSGPAVFGFPLGVYEGLLGSGNAILTSAVLMRSRGWELLTALGHYYALAAAWCALAAVVYLARGAFDPLLALYATIGSVAGGFLGARLGRTRGSAFVKPFFIVAGVVLAGRLLIAG